MKIVKLSVLLAQAAALFGAYQYYHGNAVATSQGLSAQGNAARLFQPGDSG